LNAAQRWELDYLLKLQSRGWSLGLERMTRLLQTLGNPQHGIEFVHIAGTNGKGSAAALLESILRASGQRTGLYTSPHLIDVSERIRVNGSAIEPGELARHVRAARPHIDSLECSFFEAVTALGLLHFKACNVEFGMLEVGMGGRLDATNVVVPRLSIITTISYDHTDHLGRSLAQIAGEKGGVLKPGVPCVLGILPPEARRAIVAMSQGPLFDARQYARMRDLKMDPDGSSFDLHLRGFCRRRMRLGLAGAHQLGNARIALTAAMILRNQGVPVRDLDLARGLAEVSWPARLERIMDRPLIITDVAHNPAAVRAARRALKRLYPGRSIVLVLGLMRDKDLEAILDLWIPAIRLVVPVAADHPRALPAEALSAALVKRGCAVTSAGSVGEGYELALRAAGEDDLICLTGSHAVVGEGLKKIKHLTN